MVASKIQDEGEIRRWFEEGKTYRWMSDEYLRKYNIEMSPSAFGNMRRRWGLHPRLVRDDDMIPWALKREHQWKTPLALLRIAARERAGEPLHREEQRRLASFVRSLKEDGAVIHYDPDTEEGFWRVPARPGIDKGLIREPERKTTTRRSRRD